MTNMNGEVHMNKTTILLTNILACALLAARASAEFTPQATAAPGSVPQGMNYQGRLEDAGFPVTGTRTMVFRVYSALTGGVLLWTSPAQSVSVSLGLFNAVVPVPVTTLVGGGSRYLEVQIDGTLMSPRELLNSVPYALIAKSVEGTIDVSTAGLAINANASATQPAIYISSQTGNVGVGTGSPATSFDVGGSAQFGSGATKSTFTATGALNMAAKVTAPDYTATYGLSAATAAFSGDATVGGRLGVGAPSPGTRLHVSSGVLTVDGAGSAVVVAGTELSVGGSNLVATGGRVGVGTASPGTKLHLSSGTLTIDGNAATALTTVGSVGIGTPSPTAKLSIAAPGAGNAALHIPAENGNTGFKFNRPFANNSSLEWYGSGTSLIGQIVDSSQMAMNGAWVMTPLAVSQTPLRIDGMSGQTADLLSVYTSGETTPRLHINAAGGVGVGTTNPGSKLHLSSGTFVIDGNVAAALTTVGSIGVGTPAPGAKLTVNQANAGSNALDVVYDNAANPSSAAAYVRMMQPSNSPALRLDSSTGGNGIETHGLMINNEAAGAALRILRASATQLVVDAAGALGVGTSFPASRLHVSSGTVLVDGNAATSIATVGNVGVGTGGSTPADRLEVAGGGVRLTAVAGSAGSVKLFSAVTAAATTCATQCGANTACLAAWDSAGTASTCATAALANRCLCSGFGN